MSDRDIHYPNRDNFEAHKKLKEECESIRLLYNNFLYLFQHLTSGEALVKTAFVEEFKKYLAQLEMLYYESSNKLAPYM